MSIHLSHWDTPGSPQKEGKKMKVKELREIIKTNNFDVKVMARTNGLVKAIAFDVDDLNALNQVLKNYGYTVKVEYVGTTIEQYSLTKVGA